MISFVDSPFMQVSITYSRFCFDPSSVRWVLTDDDLESLLHVLQAAPLVVLDLETTGLDEHARAGGDWGVPARVSLASLTIPRGPYAFEGMADTWVIPLSHPAGPFANRWREVLTQIASAIKLQRIPLVNQHVKFDCRWIHATTGVDLSKLIIWDTAVSSHLLDENSSTKLKERAPATFGITRWDDFDLSTPGASERVPIFDLGMYAARDTYWTFALYVLHSEWMFLDVPGTDLEQFNPETPEDIENARLGLIAKYVAMPAVAALTALEQTGIVIDATWIREKIAVSESERDRLTEELTHWFDGSVESEELAVLLPPDSVSFAPTSNWFKSWIDLALRFGDLRIAELTPAGKPSWGKSVLARQARDGGSLAAEKLLELRSHVKQLEFLNSWQSLGVVHNIPGIVEETTIHAQYNIGGHAYSRVQYHNAGAAPKTGRLSSSNPNMQQVTHDLRAAFIPRPGMVFVDLDYSQIELRVVAHIARCIPMIEAFKRGDDLHRLLATRLSGKPQSEVTDPERKAGKAGNFGLVYGMSAEGFQNYADTAYGVSLTYDESVHFRKTFFDLWEGLLEWHNSSALRVARTGQVVSPLGRVRRLPSALSGNDRDVAAAVRAGINAPVQGMASDIMMIALASISGTLPRLSGRFSNSPDSNSLIREYSKPLDGVVPIASVHDSLVAEIPFMNWETPVRECLTRMLNVGIVLEHLGCRFDVPLAVEAKIGTRWGLSDIGTMSADNRGGTINFY